MEDVRYRVRSRKTLEKLSRIAATEAAKNFGTLVNRVREERAVYVIERGGVPVAQIGPVEGRRGTLADLIALFRDRPHVDAEYLRAVEDGIKRRNKPHVRRNPWER